MVNPFVRTTAIDPADLDAKFDDVEADRAAGDNALASQINTVNAAIQNLSETRLTREEVLDLIATAINTGASLTVTTYPTVSVQGGGSAHSGSILEHTTVVWSTTPHVGPTGLWYALNGTLGGTTSGATYTVQSGEEGLVIAYKETANMTGVQPVVAQSTNTITVVTPATPVNTVAPAYTAGTTGAGAAVALDFGSTNATRYYSFTGPAVSDNTFTLAAWVRMTNDSSLNNCVLSIGDPDSTNGLELFLEVDWGWEVAKLTAWGKRSGGSSTFYLEGASTVSILDGKNYLVAFLSDGTNHKIYLVEENTSAVAEDTAVIATDGGGTGFSSATWSYGKNVDGNYLQRPAGEFMYWDTALSEANLTSLATGVDPSTVVDPYIRHSFVTGANAPETNDGTGGTYDAVQSGSGWATTTGFTPSGGDLTTTPSTTLTVNDGTWLLSGASYTGPFAYQWQLNGADISNATSASYAVPAGALTGAIYRCRVSAMVEGMVSASAYSADVTVTSGSSPPAVTLAPVTDARTVAVIDGDLAYNAHGTGIMVLQLHDGTSAVSPNTGNKPWYIEELPSGQYLHADSSIWIGRETRADSKNSWRQQILHGQAQREGTYRAEFLGNYRQGGRAIGNIWEDAAKGNNVFWGGCDIMFPNDGTISRSSIQASAHSMDWGTGVAAEYSWGWGFGWAYHGPGSPFGGTLNWIHAGAWTGSYGNTYDVRTIPLNTTPEGQALQGGASDQYATSQWYRLWTPVPNVSLKLCWYIKLSSTQGGNPRTIVWRKIGSGLWVKVIDDTRPNCNTTGARYWKTGPYNFSGLSSTQTVTNYLRSDLMIHATAGTPTLDETVIQAWLDR